MTYCPSCGAEIGDHLAYCPICDAEIISGEKIQVAKPGHTQFQQPPQGLPQLVQRNYLIWFLLSYLTGIFGLVYLYFVFEDLNKLDKYPKPAGVKSTYLDQNNLIIFIVLYVIGLGLIANYLIYSKKYGLFNDYLDTHPQKQTKLPSRNYIKLMVVRDILRICMSGLGTVLYVFFELQNGSFDPLNMSISVINMLIILGVIAGLFLVGVMIITVYLIVLDYRWQEAMNERVSIIDPNFIKKDFI